LEPATASAQKASGQLDGDQLKVDFAANARSLGAHALTASTLEELKEALRKGQNAGSHHGSSSSRQTQQ